MRVLCGEGIASHTGPELCATIREDRGEALTGECVGQPLSGENQLRGADVLRPAEGNTARVVNRDARRPRVVVEPGMRRHLLHGNREISRLSGWDVTRTASGRPEAGADDERHGEVGLAHSSGEAGERSGASCRGASGAKGRDQGECGPANHGPDTEPGSRVTCAGPHTRSRNQELKGAAHSAPPPHQHRCPPGGLLQLEEDRCARN